MSEVLPRPLSNPGYLRQVPTSSISSILVSCYICVWILALLILLSDQILHWFIVPVLACGVLVGIDAIDWLRGHLNTFDSIGILGLLGFQFFFITPLLHVLWDHWTLSQVAPPPDWRDWLGGMALLNALGLLVYRFTRNIAIGVMSRHQRRSRWCLKKHRFWVLVSVALLLTGLMQIWVYAQFGGISGYVQASIIDRGGTETAMRHMGFIFTLSESFPILALMAFVVYASQKKFSRSWWVIFLVLLAFFSLKMLFGGLRGSRSNTIWGIFWAVGIIHYWFRPISKKQVLIGCLFLIAFMYFYGFFKVTDPNSLRTLDESWSRSHLEERSGRNLVNTLLGDLGRSDIQAFILYRLSRPENDYQYAWGRTYVAAVSTLVPRSLIERPPTKAKEGTEAQYGRGTYDPDVLHSSKVYGLAGEAMLNFGSILVPFAFVILGVVVGGVQGLSSTIRSNDTRLLLLPFLVNLCFVILVGDLDNVIFFLVKNGAVPFLVLGLSSTQRIMTSQTIVGAVR